MTKTRDLFYIDSELLQKLRIASNLGLIKNKSAFIETLLRTGIAVLENKYGILTEASSKDLSIDKEIVKNIKKQGK